MKQKYNQSFSPIELSTIILKCVLQQCLLKTINYIYKTLQIQI